MLGRAILALDREGAGHSHFRDLGVLTMKPKLIKEEKEILDSFENDEWVPVAGLLYAAS